ncbi:MAG: hypothetical protein KF678_02205 [Phycisphaeraceae bacterium]|nr:hypothetical protein [Phycisphaeraceae bacterium]
MHRVKLSLAGALALASGSVAQVVVPNSAALTEGDGTFALTATAAAGRTYQFTIDSGQLAGLIGQNLTGLKWRLNGPGTAAWPTAETNYTAWDVYIGPGVDPSAMSNTFAANFTSAPTQVRSGPFSYAAGSHSFGSAPNAFGPTLDFTTPYPYTGGDLTIEMRFSAQTGSTTAPSFDAITASLGPANGWGVDFSSRWTASITGLTGGNANFLVTQIIAGSAGPTGACCLSSGASNCVVTSSAGCANLGGTYQGDGSTCATANCPPLPTGACCLQLGGCSIATQQACTNGGGTYAGNNVACAAASCTPAGRCCFSDGSCLSLTSSLCIAAGGTYGGDNTVCTTGACTQQPGNIACNGPFVTTPNGACIPAGNFQSEVQVGNTIAGFNQNGALAPAFRIADNFTVPAGETWTVNGFTLYGYQTGAGVPVSTFTGSTCQIWNGRPGDAGSFIVAGDATTNVLTSSTFTNTYRTFNAACDLTRPIFANTVTLAAPAVLPAGTYWVDYNATGSLASGPWALNVTVKGLGSPPGANGRQLPQTGIWQDLLDGVRVQEAAFCVRGTVATGGCYANCDGSTGNPLLTANDFQCFLNKYAANDTYANCDGSTGNPLLTANDFQCFLNKYAAGCT